MCFTVDEDDFKLSLIPSSRNLFSSLNVLGIAKSLNKTGSAGEAIQVLVLVGALLLFWRIPLPGNLMPLCSQRRFIGLTFACWNSSDFSQLQTAKPSLYSQINFWISLAFASLPLQIRSSFRMSVFNTSQFGTFAPVEVVLRYLTGSLHLPALLKRRY